MTDLTRTHITAVLDRSGSMYDKIADTQGGYDAFIQAQRALSGDCTVTLVQFDSLYEVVYDAIPLSDVPPLELLPRGSTALLDAVAKAIATTGEFLATLPEDRRPASVIFVIMTDGFENASREVTLEQVRTMITHQQETYSWLFQFFGADLGSIQMAKDIGIFAGNTLHYNENTPGEAYLPMARATARFRSATEAGVAYASAVVDSAFTDDERTTASGVVLPDSPPSE